MRVFISSVKHGLEEERRALPALITAMGHTPVTFEIFSAQDDPSREICLNALLTCDAYLLLLGPRYGHRFPDSGQSPTHEEWTTATARGMTRMVYRKQGVEFEPDQHELAQQIGEYTGGVFRDTFETATELQAKVAAKLRELEQTSSSLTFASLREEVHVSWRDELEGRSQSSRQVASTSALEVHVCPLPQERYSGRVMGQFADSLTQRLRRTDAVDSSSAISVTATGNNDATLISVPDDRVRPWDQPQDSRLMGLALTRSRQLSAWSSLPRDSMSTIVDPNRLPTQLADMLRLIGALNINESNNLAIAVGIESTSLLTIDTFNPGIARTRATGLSMSDEPIRIFPDESVSAVALTEGAGEVASYLSKEIIDRVRARR